MSDTERHQIERLLTLNPSPGDRAGMEGRLTVMARPRTHPAGVTADRLIDHTERWYDKMDGRERDQFATVIQVLREIEDGER